MTFWKKTKQFGVARTWALKMSGGEVVVVRNDRKRVLRSHEGSAFPIKLSSSHPSPREMSNRGE